MPVLAVNAVATVDERAVLVVAMATAVVTANAACLPYQ